MAVNGFPPRVPGRVGCGDGPGAHSRSLVPRSPAKPDQTAAAPVAPPPSRLRSRPPSACSSRGDRSSPETLGSCSTRPARRGSIARDAVDAAVRMSRVVTGRRGTGAGAAVRVRAGPRVVGAAVRPGGHAQLPSRRCEPGSVCQRRRPALGQAGGDDQGYDDPQRDREPQPALAGSRARARGPVRCSMTWSTVDTAAPDGPVVRRWETHRTRAPTFSPMPGPEAMTRAGYEPGTCSTLRSSEPGWAVTFSQSASPRSEPSTVTRVRLPAAPSTP